MKAIRFHEPGGTEVLEYVDIPKPEIVDDDDVLIRVRACSVNRLDIWLRSGMYQTDLPHILGSEISGDVEDIGSDVEGFKVGDRVLVYPGLIDETCEYCLIGEESLCDQFGIIGSATNGGYAEYVTVPQQNVFLMPDSVSYNEAAAVPLVFLTAWHMLITRGQLRLGESVLIHAAGSGIGSAAIQIAKLCGATVFTTVGTDEKLAKAKEIGADYVINYKEKDFADEIMAQTDGIGVNLVFEHTGAETFAKSVSSLKKNGRLVIAGATSGTKAELDIRKLYSRQISIIGSMLGSRRELYDILKLVGEKKLKPIIDCVLPLSQAREAHERMMDRKQFGKIILNP